MTDRTLIHDTFVLERSFDVPPARVFGAFADPDQRRRWFAGPEEWGTPEWTFDFRVGGRELNRGGPEGGPITTFECLYQDIVPNQRIVYSYDMHIDDRRISVSLATLEFQLVGSGTHLILTEQGAYLDGLDQPTSREQGMKDVLDALETELARGSAPA